MTEIITIIIPALRRFSFLYRVLSPPISKAESTDIPEESVCSCPVMPMFAPKVSPISNNRRETTRDIGQAAKLT